MRIQMKRKEVKIYDDFKIKNNPLVSMVYTNIFQGWKG